MLVPTGVYNKVSLFRMKSRPCVDEFMMCATQYFHLCTSPLILWKLRLLHRCSLNTYEVSSMAHL